MARDKRGRRWPQLSCPLPYMLPAGPQTTDPQLMLGCRKAEGRGEGNVLP